ncbi:MAG TPA: type II toxin-antitoxin system ParD family antitoxin [Kofleriaceae bacterium]|jgi:antitoxin ParD1/3/4|nr:type II toxin-antitoxin system ParD family antitoxin [Kofleriaceae bacterium]
MPTRNVSLTPQQDAFVAKMVKTGEYQNASEAIRDALRVLQLRRKEDALKLKALREQLAVGIEELERGEFTEIEGADLENYMAELTSAPKRRR